MGTVRLNGRRGARVVAAAAPVQPVVALGPGQLIGDSEMVRG
jgi:hypothetical protein